MLNKNAATTCSPPRPNCPHLCHPSRLCDSCWPVWAPSPSSRADRRGERDDWTTRTPRARGPPLAATGAPGPGRSRCCGGDSSGGGRSDPRRTPPRTPPGPGNGSRPLWPCTAWCCFHICSQEQRNEGNTGAVREKRGKVFQCFHWWCITCEERKSWALAVVTADWCHIQLGWKKHTIKSHSLAGWLRAGKAVCCILFKI